jgi:hypothetical protein
MSQNLSEENGRDAFSPENFQMVLLIQMMRTYDILLAILSIQDPRKAMELAAMHEKGLTFTPAPAFSVEDE